MVLYLKDGHSSILAKYDDTGKALSSTDYDAYGNLIYGEQADPFGYCGEYRDSESGLIYLRNRCYDSVTGRFITEDSDKDGVNWYSYCAGNPVGFVDPSGYLNTGYDENGILHDWDAEAYGVDSDTYKILCGLTEQYNKSLNIESGSVRTMVQFFISAMADLIRESANKGYEYKFLSDNELITMLKNNSNEILKEIQDTDGVIATSVFVKKVAPNGEWDYKTKEGWRWPYESDDITGEAMEDWEKNTKKFIWCETTGEFISGADIGNINYGFVALDVFTRLEAKVGAGGLQILQGRSHVDWIGSYFDDPEDSECVNLGMSLRER